MKKALLLLVPALLLAQGVEAKVDLVTLPTRDSVQLTIYNSADLTLVRESRFLTLKKGVNKLQFSWENTLIDPTSLEMLPKANADKIEVFDLTYPARVRNTGLWHIQSGVSGKVPVEITYLTSGLSWRAFYMGTLSPDEETMQLQAYVRVTNRSGEDYDDAQTRMIVGKVHLLDEISTLARRQYPYDSPHRPEALRRGARPGAAYKMRVMQEAAAFGDGMDDSIKEIRKEGLSEYFLYTIEGRETIANGWSKRLPSFEVGKVPVLNLYKYEKERYGTNAVRFLSFKNDEEHELGDTPIPGGTLKVYRDIADDAHLSYEGQSSFQYIPVGEDVELNLGPVRNVVVEPTLMDFRTDNFLFDRNGNIAGWDETREFRVTVKNTRDIPVKIEIQRNFFTQHWDLVKKGSYGKYEKIDLDTVRFTMELGAASVKEFTYTLTTRHGQRAQ